MSRYLLFLLLFPLSLAFAGCATQIQSNSHAPLLRPNYSPFLGHQMSQDHLGDARPIANQLPSVGTPAPLLTIAPEAIAFLGNGTVRLSQDEDGTTRIRNMGKGEFGIDQLKMAYQTQLLGDRINELTSLLTSSSCLLDPTSKKTAFLPQ
jgi:hypothetical protein